jgi:hypothetical protein
MEKEIVECVAVSQSKRDSSRKCLEKVRILFWHKSLPTIFNLGLEGKGRREGKGRKGKGREASLFFEHGPADVTAFRHFVG